jgi:uncharacterized protein
MSDTAVKTNRSRRPVIDCDVHQTLANGADDLFPYFSAGWQDFALASGRGEKLPVETGGAMYCFNPFGYLRKDAYPADGSPPGSNPQQISDQLLDPFNVQAGVLTGQGSLFLTGITNPYYAAEVARAYNDHLIDHWLSVDSRYKGSIALALHVPEWAAEEVRRLADHDAFIQVGVATNPQAYAFGHPMWDSLHRACAETGVAFGIHSLGEGAAGSIPSGLASGYPSLYSEYQGGGAQGLMTHLMSFIYHGVFERYPDLKLVLIEPGVTWVPSFVRRLDVNHRGIRREIPWCTKDPSDYVRENVRVTTQPLDIDGPEDDVVASLERVGAEDFLLFSSDYPHWDTDEPTATIARLPAGWRDKVAFENAASTYRLPVAAAA